MTRSWPTPGDVAGLLTVRVATARDRVISWLEHRLPTGGWFTRLAIAVAGVLVLVGCGTARDQRPAAQTAAVDSSPAPQTRVVRARTAPTANTGPTRTSTHAAPTAPTDDASGPLRRDAGTSFATLERQLQDEARVSVAVQSLGVGRLVVLGADPAMLGMSTTKVLILSALLRDRGGVSGLSSSERALAHSAITESDNDAVLELFSALERDRGGLIGASAYATSLLRDAGDRVTAVTTAPPPPAYATTFGQTPWSLTAEVRFFRYLALGCLLSPSSTAYVLGLMRSIESSERWGLGSAGFHTVAFKGGWGPLGSGYGVRQTGIVGSGGSAVVVALAADPASTFDAGTSVLTILARWLRTHLLLHMQPLPSCSAARGPDG
jgi:hypothetical protein